jgi:hypothetical protein
MASVMNFWCVFHAAPIFQNPSPDSPPRPPTLRCLRGELAAIVVEAPLALILTRHSCTLWLKCKTMMLARDARTLLDSPIVSGLPLPYRTIHPV